MENVVFDTAAILNCGKKGECEFLLERLANDKVLFTTPEIEKELRHPEDPLFLNGLVEKHFKIQSPKNFQIDYENLTQLARVLSSGELSALLLALELNAWLIMDDLTARKAVSTINVRVACTFNILADGLKRKWW